VLRARAPERCVRGNAVAGSSTQTGLVAAGSAVSVPVTSVLPLGLLAWTLRTRTIRLLSRRQRTAPARRSPRPGDDVVTDARCAAPPRPPDPASGGAITECRCLSPLARPLPLDRLWITASLRPNSTRGCCRAQASRRPVSAPSRSRCVSHCVSPYALTARNLRMAAARRHSCAQSRYEVTTAGPRLRRRRCRPQSVGSEGSVDSRGSRISRGSGTQHRLFVGNLLPATTVEELKAYFSQFGSVVDVFLPRLTGPSASRCVRWRAGGGSPPLRRISPGSPRSRSG
jgi:hypothetical protein